MTEQLRKVDALIFAEGLEVCVRAGTPQLPVGQHVGCLHAGNAAANTEGSLSQPQFPMLCRF